MEAWSSDVAAGESGDLVAVWNAPPDGAVAFSRYSRMTETWSESAILSASGHGPRVALGPAGAIVVWIDVIGGYSAVHVTRELDAGAWSQPVVVSASGDRSHAPEVVVDRAGNATVVWMGSGDPNDGSEIMAARYSVGAASWSAPINLSRNSQPSGPIYAEQHEIAVDPDGNVMVVWLQSASFPYMYVIGSWFERATSRWLGTPQISLTPGYGPDVAMDSSGNAIVTWRDFGGGVVRASRFLRSSYDWHEPIGISSMGVRTVGVPDVAVNASGDAVVAWSASDGAKSDIQTTFYKFVTNTWTLPRWQAAADAYGSGMSATIDDFGNATIAWAGVASLSAARYTASLNLWTTAVLSEARADFMSLAQERTGAVQVLFDQVWGAQRLLTARRWHATLAPPRIAAIVPRAGGLDVFFDLPSTADIAFRAQNLQFSTDGGASWQTRSPASTASPLAINSVVDPGSVRIRAVNAAGAGLPSSSTGEGPAHGRIHGRIVVDANGNGVRDPGEGFLRHPLNDCAGTPLDGASVSWSGTASGSAIPTLCNDVGPYYDSGFVPAGNYTLAVSLPAGWQATGPAAVPLSVLANETTHASFFAQPLLSAAGRIHGRIVVDTNGNGVLDAGEGFARHPLSTCAGTAINGFAISWSGASTNSTAADKCDASGPYYDSGPLPAGGYTLQVAVPIGWEPTGPTSLTLSVGANQSISTTFFVRQRPIVTSCGSDSILRSNIARVLAQVRTRSQPTYIPNAVGDSSGLLSLWGGKWAVYDELYFTGLDLQMYALQQLLYANQLAQLDNYGGACRFYTEALKTDARAIAANQEAIAVWEQGATHVTKALLAVAKVGCHAGVWATELSFGLRLGVGRDMICAAALYAIEQQALGAEIDALGVSKEVVEAAVVGAILSGTNLTELGGRSVTNWAGEEAGKQVGGAQLYRLVARHVHDGQTRTAIREFLAESLEHAAEEFLDWLANRIIEGLDAGFGAAPDVAFDAADGLVTTTDGQPPRILAATPDRRALAVAVDIPQLLVTFDADVTSGSGSAILIGEDGTVALPLTQGHERTSTWRIPYRLRPSSTYTIVLPAGVVLAVPGLGNERATWTFTTAADPFEQAQPVTVQNTGGAGLRVPTGPGIAFPTWLIAPENVVCAATGNRRHADRFTWHECSAGAASGWLATGDWLIGADSGGVRAGGTALVTNTGGAGLPLFDEPSPASSPTAILPDASRVRVLSGPFFVEGFMLWMVRHGERTGYVATAPWLVPASQNAPRNVRASATASMLMVSWSPVMPFPTAHRLDFYNSGRLVATVNTGPAGGVTLAIPPGVQGTYSVRVTSLNRGAVSAASRAVTFEIPRAGCTAVPAQVTTVSGELVDGIATVAWSPAVGADGYILQAGSMAGAVDLFNGVVGKVTSVSAGPLPAGFTAYVRIVAINTCGLGSPSPDHHLR